MNFSPFLLTSCVFCGLSLAYASVKAPVREQCRGRAVAVLTPGPGTAACPGMGHARLPPKQAGHLLPAGSSHPCMWCAFSCRCGDAEAVLQLSAFTGADQISPVKGEAPLELCRLHRALLRPGEPLLSKPLPLKTLRAVETAAFPPLICRICPGSSQEVTELPGAAIATRTLLPISPAKYFPHSSF